MHPFARPLASPSQIGALDVPFCPPGCVPSKDAQASGTRSIGLGFLFGAVTVAVPLGILLYAQSK